MSNMELFNNGDWKVRVVMIDDQPWFVAKDVATILGYTDTTQAIRKHCKGGVETTVPSNGGYQMAIVIPERDVFRLIMRSKLPTAEQFEEWVVGEVLPSIRKHGAYLTPETIEKTLNDPDFIIGLATKLKDERQARLEAEQRLAIAEPQAQKYQQYLDADGTMTFTNIGKHYLDGMSPQKVAKFLQNHGVLRKSKIDGAYVPQSGFERYFKLIPYVQNGVVVSNNLNVKTEGLDFIVELYSHSVKVMA